MNTTTKTPAQYLGLDVGFGNFKAVYANGQTIIPAHVATNGTSKIGRIAGLQSFQKPPEVFFNEGSLYVGTGSENWGRPIENMDTTRITLGTPEIRALTYATLTEVIKAQAIGDTVRIVIGVPNELLTGEQTDAIAKNIRKWLEGKHAWKVDGVPYQIEVEKVFVTGQAVGGLFDYVLDDSSTPLRERSGALRGEVYVLSIGANTAESLVLKDRKPVPASTGSDRIGVRRLLEILNPGHLWVAQELDANLRNGSLAYKHALPIWGSEVVGYIERMWGQKWKRAEAVLLFGGGALLLRDLLTEYFNGKAWLPDDPIVAIASGLYKMAPILDTRKAK